MLTSVPPTRGLGPKLRKLRELLAKDFLSSNDVFSLSSMAGELLRFAAWTQANELRGECSANLVGPLSRRFLVLDALISICEVVGPAMNKEQWWGKLMETMSLSLPQDVASLRTRYGIATHDWVPLVRRIVAAIGIYREGRRPPPREVVEIKQEIFCKPIVHREFRSSMWNPWREDDKKFLG